MRVVRGYDIVYVLGRAVMLAVFFLVVLPILAVYVAELWKFVTGRPSMFCQLDVLIVALVLLVLDLGGVLPWLIQLQRGTRR
jgi:hypothetical protein